MNRPRGLRNNNPLNIRHSADCWQGARKKQQDLLFVEFKSMAYGYRAAWKVLQSYYEDFRKHGKLFTLRNIVSRWAPPCENDTEAYITRVVQLTSIGGNQKLLPPLTVESYGYLSKLIVAMTCVECGISPSKVDTEAICKGYRLAFLENDEALDEWLKVQDEFRVS